jgi:hypothetical protein
MGNALVESVYIFADKFIDKQIDNEKAPSSPCDGPGGRFEEVMSDPSNLLIDRCENAGKIIDGNVVCHNNIIVPAQSYYGDFADILTLNKGVHEPAEERMFGEVLKYIPDNGTIIELGAYWAFYSMWFSKEVVNSNVYCVEPDSNNLETGKNNCKLNNVAAEFTQGRVSNLDGFRLATNSNYNNFNVKDFVEEKNIEFIDILHSDIQGCELVMLNDIIPLLVDKKIRYLFVSTHTQEIHYSCIELLERHDYRIIASADFDNETFCFDGIIVACHKDNLDIPYTSLGCRRHTPLQTTCMV